MSIVKAAGALIALATLAGAAAPAHAQFGATTMPNYRIDATSGNWMNPPGRGEYRMAPMGAYASTACQSSPLGVWGDCGSPYAASADGAAQPGHMAGTRRW